MKYYRMDPIVLDFEFLGEFEDQADAVDAAGEDPVFSEDDLRSMIESAQQVLNESI